MFRAALVALRVMEARQGLDRRGRHHRHGDGGAPSGVILSGGAFLPIAQQVMSVEIDFPLEFVVTGTPVSLQTKRADTRLACRAKVKAASSASLPEGHFSATSPIAVTLFYFPETEMQGDIDNIVEPVLDALSRHVYADDRQVERVWVQKFEPGRIFAFTNPSAVLEEALRGSKPRLFVRIHDDPREGLA